MNKSTKFLIALLLIAVIFPFFSAARAGSRRNPLHHVLFLPLKRNQRKAA